MTRVLIADDHVLVRRGLRELCREMSGYSVAGMAASGDEVLAALGCTQVDLMLLDLMMPGISGSHLIKAIRRLTPQIPILVFSMIDDPHVVRRVVQAGVSGFVAKGSCIDTLMLAMRRVVAGGRFIDSSINEKLLFDLSDFDTSTPRECLSPRELQVMTLLARGLNVTMIAAKLSISDKTVSTHKIRLMRKLSLRNDAELVCCAVDHSLVD